MTRSRFGLAPTFAFACSLIGVAGCSNNNGSPPSQTGGGSGQSSSGSAGSGSGDGSGASGASAGTASGEITGNSSGSEGAGAASGNTVTSGNGGSGNGSSGNTASSGSESGSDMSAASGSTEPEDSGAQWIDAAGRTPPTCAKPTPPPNETGGAQGSRPGECDVLLQSLDFEVAYSYPSTPATIKVTNFGNAFGLFEINNCSPYCFAKNLTVGVDIVGGGAQADLQGEIIVEFPQTGPGLPITVADMTRNSLAWITFDGPAKPPFEIDTQMIVETSAGVFPAVEVKPFFKAGGNQNPYGPFSVANNYSYGNGSEFKYFPFTSTTGYPNGLMNVTGMGFRIVAKAAAGQSWHGVVYIDHLQIRGGGAQNPPGWPGAYPYTDAGL